MSATGRLAGKVAVITGTGGAIGAAMAIRFAAEGASVMGCDLRADAAQATTDVIRDNGGQAGSIHCDVSDEAQVTAMIATAERSLGAVDVLVNCASWTRTGRGRTVSAEDFRASFDGTVTTYWLTMRAAAAAMQGHGGGNIVNIASIAGLPLGTSTLGNSTFMFAYALGKAAVIRMTQLMAIELSSHGIRCNAVSPGPIDTPAVESMIGEPGSPLRHAVVGQSLIPRVGQVADVVNAALFLASDEASYITGHNLVVDGGWAVSGTRGQPDPTQSDLYRTGRSAES